MTIFWSPLTATPHDSHSSLQLQGNLFQFSVDSLIFTIVETTTFTAFTCLQNSVSFAQESHLEGSTIHVTFFLNTYCLHKCYYAVNNLLTFLWKVENCCNENYW